MRKRASSLLAFLCFGGQLMFAGEPKFVPFQGHLTTASGEPIATEIAVVLFKIYDAPVAGAIVWPGEVHRLSVNAGLVNTILGTKTSMEEVDFSRTRYLELTVDADGDGKVTDADPPLLPRQIILPAVFAIEASKMMFQNETERGAAGWEVLFGGQNPATGFIPGDKIAVASLPLDRLSEKVGPGALVEGASLANLQDGSIPGSKLEAMAVGRDQIAEGAVGSDQLSEGAITENELADGAVTLRKLAPIELGPVAGEGQMAISEVEPGFSFSGNTFVPVETLAVEIQTTGRPVEIFLVPDMNAQPAGGFWNTAGTNSSSVIGLFMDDELVAEQGMWVVANTSPTVRLGVPPSAIRFLRRPSAGLHRFDIRVRVVGGNSNLSGVQLVAIER